MTLRWRTVARFTRGINPSTEKAFVVELTEPLSRKNADALRDRLNGTSPGLPHTGPQQVQIHTMQADPGVAALLAAAEGAQGWGPHVRLGCDDVADWLRGRAEEWPTHPWNPLVASPAPDGDTDQDGQRHESDWMPGTDPRGTVRCKRCRKVMASAGTKVTADDEICTSARDAAPDGDTEWVMVGETLEPLRHPGAGWTPHAPRAVTPPPREYGLRAIFDAATRERAIAVLMGRRGVEDDDQGAYDAAWSDWDALVVAGLTAVRDGEAGDRG